MRTDHIHFYQDYQYPAIGNTLECAVAITGYQAGSLLLLQSQPFKITLSVLCTPVPPLMLTSQPHALCLLLSELAKGTGSSREQWPWSPAPE